MNPRGVGVCIVGSNGAVATTVMAGIALMKKGISPRIGMVSEGALRETLDLVPLEDIAFGGWDLSDANVYEAACKHRVVPREMLDLVKDELSAIRPWPTVVSPDFLHSMAGRHVLHATSTRDELAMLGEQVKTFQREKGVSRLVIVNLSSTEKFCEVEDVHQSVERFEQGLDESDRRISPAMKFLYLACKLGVPHCNFTPSRSMVPALSDLAERRGIPIAGEDGKTGQTFVKTVLAPAFVIRQLGVDGWFSTNILGNNDGLVLNDPASNKTKVLSKQSVLDDILGYPVPNHQVHIHYYPPRGDAKEAWDNIDLVGFLGERMQLKVNFLCKDSILAAPLIIDLVRFLDRAHRHGDRGIQRQLSVFFKSPYHDEGEKPVHDLFKQNELLLRWAESVAQAKQPARLEVV